METFDSSTNSMESTTEIYVKKILAGNVNDVRRRLIASIEAMGYDVIEEEPNIIGRRGAKGWGVWLSSADVLEYAMVLTVRLKPVGQNSTRATFDYLVKHPFLNKGEKAIVAQEAKTIASISKKHAIEKMCSICETESTDDSKFCRQCGAPLTSEQAELETLRMMAEVRAGKTSVVSSFFLMAVSTIILFTFIMLNMLGKIDRPKIAVIFMLFGGISAGLAMLSVVFGWNRINRALNKPETQRNHAPRYVPEALETGEFAELPSSPVRAIPPSVTEGTTNLLDDEWTRNREREKIPVHTRRDTKDLN